MWEGYTALAALAQATERIRLGMFVGTNSFRTAPHDLETMETLMTVVKPMVEGVPLTA